jgi:hypothetical protein
MARILEWLRQFLGADFDLEIRPVKHWSLEPNVRSITLWVAKVLAISISFTAVFITGFLVILLELEQPWRRWVGQLGLVFCGLVLPLAVLTPVYRREARQQEQINPTWRVRRPKLPAD